MVDLMFESKARWPHHHTTLSFLAHKCNAYEVGKWTSLDPAHRAHVHEVLGVPP